MTVNDTERPAQIVIDVDHLSIAYATRKSDVEAVCNVSFTLREGETVGLVGESGCGKSTIAYGIVKHLGPNGKITSGQIRFQGTELVGKRAAQLKNSAATGSPWCFRTPCRPSTRRCDSGTNWPRCSSAIARCLTVMRGTAPLPCSGGSICLTRNPSCAAIPTRSPVASNSGWSSPWPCSTIRPC